MSTPSSAGQRQREGSFGRPAAIRKKDLAALVVICTVSAALLAFCRDPRPNGTAWLFGEAGWRADVADTLLHGKQLYVDVFFPYGPLNAWYDALAALALGNMPTGMYVATSVSSLANVALAYAVLRTYLSVPRAAIYCLAGLLGVFLAPLAFVGVGTAGGPVERALILVVVYLWCDPLHRDRVRSATLGAAMGLMQWNKFGGAFLVGVAVLALDVISVGWARLWTGEGRRAWLESLLMTLAGFLAVEAARWGWAFATLPTPIAWDVAFPLFYIGNYDWITEDIRFIRIDGIRIFLYQYLTPTVALGLSSYGLFVAIRKRSTLDTNSFRLFLPLILYAVFLVAYLPSAHHQRGFLWMLMFPAAWTLHQMSRLRFAVAALMLTPALIVSVRSRVLAVQNSQRLPFQTPKGVLYLPENEHAVASAIASELKGENGREYSRGAIFWTLSGFNHFFDIPSKVRHRYFVTTAIRPYERDKFVEAVTEMDAVFLLDTPKPPRSANPCSWLRTPQFPQVCPRIAAVLDSPIHIAGGTYVFRVKQPERRSRD